MSALPGRAPAEAVPDACAQGGAGRRPVHEPASPAAPRAARERLVLRDGRGVWVRPVQAGDAAAARSFFVALSPHSRRRRFHGAMAQLPTTVARAMTQLDFHQHVALVAEAAAADGAARLVADARYVRADAGAAEFAIAVADDWQGAGLGRALLQRLGWHARASGITTFTGSVLADNLPMLALMQDLGASRQDDLHEAGLVRIVVRL